MTIFIDKVQVTGDGAMGFISELDDLARQIASTWHESNIEHYFKNQRGFDKAIHRNLKFLKANARGKAGALFTSSNYLFSTQAEGREETLYFRDRATNGTGRLRQQHPKGPLAKIDKKPRTHRFLSKKRFECVNEWRDKHMDGLPRFYVSEKQAKNGEHHLEFACDGKEVSGWHPSGGTVRTSKRHLEHRIDRALKEILGIR